MNYRNLAPVVALVILSAAAPATADELLVETGITTAYYTDASFDALSEFNAHSNWTIGAGWAFDRLGGLQLGALFQTTPRLTASRFGGDVYTEWGRQRFLATADWGFSVLRFLRPHLGGGVGYAHQFLAVHGFGPRLKDHAHDLTANLGAGLDVNVPYRWGRIAVTSSFGYELSTHARFDELRHDRKAFDDDYAPDGDPWDRVHADFGTLRLSGLYWTIGLDFAFDL